MKDFKYNREINERLFTLKKSFLVKRKRRYNRSLNFRNWCTEAKSCYRDA